MGSKHTKNMAKPRSGHAPTGVTNDYAPPRWAPRSRGPDRTSPGTSSPRILHRHQHPPCSQGPPGPPGTGDPPDCPSRPPQPVEGGKGAPPKGEPHPPWRAPHPTKHSYASPPRWTRPILVVLYPYNHLKSFTQIAPTPTATTTNQTHNP